jgi:hypothetical protein
MSISCGTVFLLWLRVPELERPAAPQLELQVLCLGPRVLSRTDLRVRFQKMVQHVQEREARATQYRHPFDILSRMPTLEDSPMGG